MGGTISDIVKVVDDAVKQVIFQIDPSINKLTNTTLILLDRVESKLHQNGSQAISTLRRNLFIWLFLTILFSIFILLLIRYFLDILHRLQIGLLTRQYLTLFLLTIIVFWMFISSLFAVFLSNDLDWVTLKLIVFVFLSLILLFFFFLWFRFFKIYQKRLGRSLKSFFCQWTPFQDKTNRLKQSTLALHMLAIQKKTLQESINQI